MIHRLVTLTTGKALCLLDIAAMALVWPPLFILVLGGTMRAIGHGWVALALYPIANLVSLYALGLYRRDVGIELRKSLARIPLASAVGALGAGGALVLLDGAADQGSRMAWSAAGFLVSGCLARVAFDALRRHGVFSRTLLVIGAGSRAWDLVWMLKKEGPNLSYHITFVHGPAWGGLIRV